MYNRTCMQICSDLSEITIYFTLDFMTMRIRQYSTKKTRIQLL